MYKSLFRVQEFEDRIERLHEKNLELKNKLSETVQLFHVNQKEKKAEIAQLKAQIEELLSDPGLILKEILKGNLEWYDYKELTPSDRETYQRFADAVRTNPAFVNEMNHLFQMLSLKALSEPKTLEGLRDLQICAVAVESIKRHFADIPKPPKKPEEVQDPNSTL